MYRDASDPAADAESSSAFALAGADESGQGLAEYGLILGFIAVLCIAAVFFLSGSIQGMLSNIGSSI